MKLTSLILLCSLTTFSAVLQGAEQPLDYDALVQQAIVQRNNGDMANAEAMLRQAFVMAENKSEAAYLLGLVIAFQERYDEAMTVLDAALVDYPQDTNLLLARARVLSYQGLHREAGDLAESILARQPQNQEARNLTARIALYQRRPAFAKTLFEAVSRSLPDDLEALIGLHDAELALGNREAAHAVLARAATVAPGHIDVVSRQAAEALPGAPQHTWVTGYERSRTDNDQPHWNDRFLEYHHLYNRNSAQSLRLSHNHRFGTHDTSIATSVLLRQQTATPLQIGLSVTPDANFSAQRSASVGIGRRISEGNERIGTTVMQLNLQAARYSTGNVLNLGISAEHYLRNVDAWLTAGTGVVRAEDSNNIGGWHVGAHWQASAALRLGLTWSRGGETENAVTTRSRSTGGYISWRFDNRWHLQLNLGQSRREGSYTRETAALTLQYRY